MPGREGQEGNIPISQRIIDEQSQATIKNLLDALVELVTNSDDSYRRLESEGLSPGGSISVYVQRRQGGVVPYIVVQDEAEGMTLDRILDILEFGADSSGFTSGRNLRGLFGKGLKEAIFALGSGQIESVQNGEMSAVSLWRDETSRVYRWRVEKDRQPSHESNGTKISIMVSHTGITSPTWNNLREQFQTHFALRDICSTRSIELTLHDTRIRNTQRMQYTPPNAEQVLAKDLQVRTFGEIHLEVSESEEPLFYSRNNPCSIAGVVVKTEDIPLDNHAFGFENDEAAHYFSGTLEVSAIADMLRNQNLSLLSPSRAGIDWRNTSANALQNTIREQLRPLIDRKRRELESGRRTATRETFRRKLQDLCDLLNQLAEEELEDDPPFGSQIRLEGLAIRPEVGYARPSEQRNFSIYLPRSMARANSNPRISISIEDVQGYVRPSSTSVTLAPRQSNPEILTGRFSMEGADFGDSCTIYVQWEDEQDIAEFYVREPVNRDRPDSPIRNRGLFRDIHFDDQTAAPTQRVSFNSGNITIFLNFPTVRNYLGPGGDGMDTPLGSLMCAEMVAEAFGREVARRRIESGAIIPAQGGEIDAYNGQLNALSEKCLRPIHTALVQLTPPTS